MQITDDHKIQIVAAVIGSDVFLNLIQTTVSADKRDHPVEIARLVTDVSVAIITDVAKRIP